MKVRVNGTFARVKDVQQANMERQPILAPTVHQERFQQQLERPALTHVMAALHIPTRRRKALP